MQIGARVLKTRPRKADIAKEQTEDCDIICMSSANRCTDLQQIEKIAKVERYPYPGNVPGIPERTNEFAGAYAKQCLAVAAECGVSSIDLWGKMQEFPGWQTAYLRDGLHLTRDGNKVVFEEVIARLREKQIRPDTLPSDLPLLDDIDPNDPLKSFE
ncbi:GDSL esterase/lipase [Striga asiatica]|uniref:GDSL esterase/lipase n=1 Tax=Striga asiatica TaxID=4170 RepID=A0A5A7NUC5_STRAF|nr:GDSL esterase/lipase [Striga asiatica]